MTRCQPCIDKRKAKYRARVERGECVRCKKTAITGQFCLHHWFCNLSVAKGRGVTAAQLAALWEKQDGICALSGQHLVPGFNASIDHILPTARGGLDVIENLQWVTIHVNRAKLALTVEEFITMCHQVVKTHESSAT